MDIDPESLLSALRSARGKGLSLKQLAGQLRLGQAQKDPLRRALSHLLKQGRASYDGHVYRERQRQQGQNGERPKGGDGDPQMGSKEPRRDHPRRSSAARRTERQACHRHRAPANPAGALAVCAQPRPRANHISS